jgi:hypothetical protein
VNRIPVPTTLSVRLNTILKMVNMKNIKNSTQEIMAAFVMFACSKDFRICRTRFLSAEKRSNCRKCRVLSSCSYVGITMMIW